MKRHSNRFVARLRRSLSLRVSVLIAVAVAAAVGVMGFYVINSIREGLFDERADEIIRDATFRQSEAQAQLDFASVTTQDQVQNAAILVIQGLQEPTAGVSDAQLLGFRGEDAAVTIGDLQSTRPLNLSPSEELRAAVETERGGNLHWQSVGIPTAAGAVPGIMVGSTVEVPLAGRFGLYLTYSLGGEQYAVDLTTRTLAIGTAILVGALTAIIWAIMWRVLRPVREAAIAAERIAAGLLQERMDVRGADELATLARSFNEMAESLQQQILRLEELSRFQQRFVSDVSHELRTPLTTIRMAADVLNTARSGFDPVTRRSAELLYNQLDRFEAMLADLLEISRFDAGAAVLVAEEQDLRPVIERVVEYWQPLAERKESTIRLRGFENAATAAIDGRRVERVVRNLVVNAIEHCNGHPVDVTLYDGDDAVALRVLDTGVGMSPQTAEHVFDRFWRADPARARTMGGTGLGLAISLEDARLHGGTLEAGGEEGVFASFLLTLPKIVGAAFTPPASVIPPELAKSAGGAS